MFIGHPSASFSLTEICYLHINDIFCGREEAFVIIMEEASPDFFVYYKMDKNVV